MGCNIVLAMAGDMMRRARPCLRVRTIVQLALLVALGGAAAAPTCLAQAPRSSTTEAVKPNPEGEEAKHWAFVPPVRPAVPRVKDKQWVRNPIDAFVIAALAEHGLHPTPEADRLTLLRRLSFDLTGLPPTPEEQDAFLADQASDAYERQVDRLLASQSYGERWAQHWLDLARYADSDGFEFDQARPNAWRYRDWVIGALNADLPYDAFVREQLAGDETNPDDSSAFIATGFNRCYPDMVDLNDQALRRQNALNDMTETTGLVFLGLTIGCARCHDHKFDPLSTVDFYRLQAFFTPARFRDDYPLASAAERARYERATTEWQNRLAALESAILELEQPARARLAPGPPPGLSDEMVIAFSKPAGARSQREVDQLFTAFEHDRRVHPGALVFSLGATGSSMSALLRERLKALRKDGPPPLPRARGLDEAGGAVPVTYLLRRGDFGARGARVEPGFPAVLTAASRSASPAIRPMARSSGRRSALADWLIRPDHPLTARVIVNRLWQHHFSRGIVATPSDFGTMGAEPSHPALLDWLAAELIARGWHLKAINRLIVTSATYRQSSRFNQLAFELDPENTLLWRQNRRRLDGEAIRDALLAVSGQLDRTMGGPPVFPELPAELTRLSSKGAIWPVSPRASDRNRRSVYVFVRRNLRYPFFEVFDRPDTNASCPRRSITTIAPQALSLLNGKLASRAAQALADRVAREAGAALPARVRRAYRLALGRPPTTDEEELGRAFLERGASNSLSSFCLALLNINEFLYVD